MLLCAVVLAVARMARLPGRDRRRRALAMAGSHSFYYGLRGVAPVRVGLRLDRQRNTRSDDSSHSIGGGWPVPLCQESDVLRFGGGMARALGYFRASEFETHWGRCGHRVVCPPVCDPVRGAHATEEIWCRLRRILPQRE